MLLLLRLAMTEPSSSTFQSAQQEPVWRLEGKSVLVPCQATAQLLVLRQLDIHIERDLSTRLADELAHPWGLLG